LLGNKLTRRWAKSTAVYSISIIPPRRGRRCPGENGAYIEYPVSGEADIVSVALKTTTQIFAEGNGRLRANDGDKVRMKGGGPACRPGKILFQSRCLTSAIVSLLA
jgi:hypothetical protein